MINVNPKSWHYRLATFRWRDSSGCIGVRNDLCGYVWQVIGRLLLNLLIVGGSIITAGSMIFFGYVGLANIQITSVPLTVFGVYGFMCWFAVGIGLASLLFFMTGGLISWGVDKWQYRERKHQRASPRFYELIREYIKARKQKWCPSLTFNEESDHDRS